MRRPTLKEIGKQGEYLILNYFKDKGCNAVLSSCDYDEEKDLVVDGVKVEMKTQTIYRMFPMPNGSRAPAFTVDIETAYGKKYRNQLNKCKNVERLIFVARPSKRDQVIRIYEAQPVEKRRYHVHRNAKDGRKVAGFMISDMTEIGTVTKDMTVAGVPGEKIITYFMDDWRER